MSEYNCSYNNGVNFFGIPREPYSIEQDPKFVEPVNGNFELLRNSPCRNSGVEIPSLHPTVDIRGIDTMGAPSMGAYEYKEVQAPQNLRGLNQISHP